MWRSYAAAVKRVTFVVTTIKWFCRILRVHIVCRPSVYLVSECVCVQCSVMYPGELQLERNPRISLPIIIITST